MADLEKKIEISAVDTGISATFNKIEQSDDSLTNNSIKNSGVRKDALSDEIGVIDDLLKKRDELDKKSPKERAKQRREGGEDLFSMPKKYKNIEQPDDPQSVLDTLKNKAIRNYDEGYKERLRTLEQTKKNEPKNKAKIDSKIEALKTKREKDTDKIANKIDRENDKKTTQNDKLKEKAKKDLEKLQATQRKTDERNKILDQKKIEGLKTKQDRDAALKKRESISNRKKRFRKFGHAGETGINASISGIGSALSSGNAYGGVMSAMGGVGSSIASMIPVVGGIVGTAVSAVTGIFTAALSQSRKEEETNLMAQNLTGGDYGGGVGFMTNDVLSQQISSISKQRGKKGHGEIVDQLNLERLTGQDVGGYGGMNKFTRLFDSNEKTTAKLTEKFLNLAIGSKLWDVDKGDFSNVAAQINANVIPLLQREAELFEKVSGRGIETDIKFAGLGTAGWQDSTMRNQRVGAIDQSLRNPVNAFVDTLIKSTIMKQNPGVGLMGLTDIQEQGLANPKLFGGVLQSIKSLPKREDQHLALMTMIPMLKGNEAARQALLDNSDIFNKNLNEGDLQKELSNRGVDKKTIKDIMASRSVAGAQQSVENQILTKLGEMGRTLVDILHPLVETIPDLLKLLGRVIKDPVGTTLEELGVTKDLKTERENKLSDMMGFDPTMMNIGDVGIENMFGNTTPWQGNGTQLAPAIKKAVTLGEYGSYENYGSDEREDFANKIKELNADYIHISKYLKDPEKNIYGGSVTTKSDMMALAEIVKGLQKTLSDNLASNADKTEAKRMFDLATKLAQSSKLLNNNIDANNNNKVINEQNGRFNTR